MSIVNVAKNLIQPFYGTDRIGGAAVEIGSSAGVEWFVRWMTKNKGQSLFDIVTAHTISKPFRGGLTAFSPGVPLQKKGDHVQQLLTGAKDGMAVLFGYWLVSISQKGFLMKFPSFWEMFVVLGSKSAHQEILSFAQKWTPDALAAQLDVGDVLKNAAEKTSNLKMKN